MRNLCRSTRRRFAFALRAALALALAFAIPCAGALAQTASSANGISGRVQNDSGGPVAAATVTLNGPTNEQTATANDGSFTLAGLPNGTYTLSVRKENYKAVSTQVVLSGATQTFTFTLAGTDLTSLKTIGTVTVGRGSTAINTTPSATQTVNASAFIDTGNFQVSNVLEQQNGVELQRFSSGGGQGANTVIALRGADPGETQVLIDGHPVNGGPDGTYLIQFLNPLLLSDVEIAKGPGAYGNLIQNAVGGTVNFQTPSITKSLSTFFNFGYDSYNGSTYAGLVSDTIGKVGLLAGYARFGTPGYYSGTILTAAVDGNAQIGQIPNGTITQGITSSETYDNRSELLKLSYNFSPVTRFQVGYFGRQTYADYTGNLTTVEPVNIIAGPCAACGNNVGSSGLPTYNNPVYAGLVGSTQLVSTNYDNEYLGNYENDNEPLFTADFNTQVGPGSLLLRYYAGSIVRAISDPAEAQQYYQCDDPTCSPAVIAANNDFQSAFYQPQTDILHGGDFEFDLPSGENTYTLSYDTHSDRTTACDGSVPNPTSCSIPSILTTSGTFSARGDFRLFHNKLDAQLANYFSNTTYVGSRYDPQIGFAYRPNPNVAIRLAGGSAYVAPNASEGNDAITQVNRKTLYQALSLKPETSSEIDLGADIKTDSVSKFTFDLYNTNIYNRFASYQVNLSSPGTYAGQTYNVINFTTNQANARNAGIELQYTRAPRLGLGVNADLNFLRTYAYGSNPIFNQGGTVYGNEADGEQYPGYPYTHGGVTLSYATRGFTPQFDAQYYGAWNSFDEPAFVLFDAGLNFNLNYGIKASVAVQNLFNHDDYRTLGEYGYGITPNGGNPTSLYFAPPRQFTFQLSHKTGAVL